jgi:hypothetical protein
MTQLASSFGGIFVEWAKDFLSEAYPAGLPEGVVIGLEEHITLDRVSKWGSDQWEDNTTIKVYIKDTNYTRTFHGTGVNMMKAVAAWDDARRVK